MQDCDFKNAQTPCAECRFSEKGKCYNSKSRHYWKTRPEGSACGAFAALKKYKPVTVKLRAIEEIKALDRAFVEAQLK